MGNVLMNMAAVDQERARLAAIAGAHIVATCDDDSALEDLAAWFRPAFDTAFADGLVRDMFIGWRSATQDPVVRKWLAGAGIPDSAFAWSLVGVGRADLEPRARGWWEPAAERKERAGRPCIMIPQMTADPQRSACECLEIVAADPRDPGIWAIRTGFVGILCRDPLEMAIGGFNRARIRLFENPLDWLRSGPLAAGFCVLDFDCGAATDLLAAIDAGEIEVVCDNDDHAAWLRGIVRPRRPKLQIAVAE